MNWRPASHIRWTECQAVFRHCLHSFGSYEESLDYIQRSGVSQGIVELAEVNESVLLELERLEKPSVAVLNRPEMLHFAVLAKVGNPHLSLLSRAVAHQRARKHLPLAGIQTPYADCLVAFLRGGSLEMPTLSASIKKSRYLPYISYMCAIDREPKLQAAREAATTFQKWNADKRSTDWTGLDGDGHDPALWDFRLCALQLQ